MTFQRMQTTARSVLRIFSCRSAVDAIPPHAAAGPCPLGLLPGWSPHGVGASTGPTLPTGDTAGASGSSIPRPFATLSTTASFTGASGSSIPRPLTQPGGGFYSAGIFRSGASSSQAGGSGAGDEGGSGTGDDFNDLEDPDQDVLATSQLGGAPLPQNQDLPQETPTPDVRAGNVVPPDRLTYSQGHVRAHARRDRGKRARQ